MHKIGEEEVTQPNVIKDLGGTPITIYGHNLTNWLCCKHFAMVMGPASKRIHGCGDDDDRDG